MEGTTSFATLALPKATVRLLLLPQAGLRVKASGLTQECFECRFRFRRHQVENMGALDMLSLINHYLSVTAIKHDGAQVVDWSNAPAMTLTLELTIFH